MNPLLEHSRPAHRPSSGTLTGPAVRERPNFAAGTTGKPPQRSPHSRNITPADDQREILHIPGGEIPVGAIAPEVMHMIFRVRGGAAVGAHKHHTTQGYVRPFEGVDESAAAYPRGRPFRSCSQDGGSRSALPSNPSYALLNFFMDGFPPWRFGDNAFALDAV